VEFCPIYRYTPCGLVPVMDVVQPEDYSRPALHYGTPVLLAGGAYAARFRFDSSADSSAAFGVTSQKRALRL
jgi:hypothetical protein